MIPFQTEHTSFGRHETFPLRFGWLTKGVGAWFENPNIFEQDDAIVKLGVGKNMVGAIQYWMKASQLVTINARSLHPSEVCKKIFFIDGWDPYLEDDATIWLIHWLIASNPADATFAFWFFNHFHKPEFTAKELQDALSSFVQEKVRSKVAPQTLKKDVALILRMYESSDTTQNSPLEEALDSPMALLGLLMPQDGGKVHISRPSYRSNLPVSTFSYAVAQLFEQTEHELLTVEFLLKGDGFLACPGAVFRINEDCLVAKLEEMILWLPGCFELRQTAGIHQLYKLCEISPESVLERHYQHSKLAGGTQ